MAREGARQYWLILASRGHSDRLDAYAMAYPADQTIAATKVADDFNANYVGEFGVIKVAPIKAPSSWDVFDVVPESVERRGQ